LKSNKASQCSTASAAPLALVIEMPSKYDSAEARRKEIHGYPLKFKFTDPEKLKEYFSGETITCLRCGKKYRTLGVHLKTIHEMEPDEYREIYGIPWTKGLSCLETTKLHAEAALINIETGAFSLPSAEQAELARRSLHEQRSRQPIRDAYTKNNLERMNKGKTGEWTKMHRNATKRGTAEHREKMIRRPQCQPDVVGKRLGDYWRGREQTDEHVYNRTGYHKKT